MTEQGLLTPRGHALKCSARRYLRECGALTCLPPPRMAPDTEGLKHRVSGGDLAAQTHEGVPQILHEHGRVGNLHSLL